MRWFKKKKKASVSGTSMLDTISRLNKESVETLENISKELDIVLSFCKSYMRQTAPQIQEQHIEETKTDPEYYNMQQIAKMTGIGINTLTKYCNVLISQHKINYRTNGKNSGKLYSKEDINTIINYYKKKNPSKVTKIAKLS